MKKNVLISSEILHILCYGWVRNIFQHITFIFIDSKECRRKPVSFYEFTKDDIKYEDHCSGRGTTQFDVDV